MKMIPRRRWTMRPGQAWERLHPSCSGVSYVDTMGPVALVRKVPRSGGKRWVVLVLATGAQREERFSTHDSWRRVA